LNSSQHVIVKNTKIHKKEKPLEDTNHYDHILSQLASLKK